MSEASQGRVSVIIPARNEEANIERVVRSVAGQEDVREILVVDDRSEDRTGKILEQLRSSIPKLRIIGTGTLPDGWLGKNRALATGARIAGGEWLLFTDADTDHRPGSLRTLMDRAERENAALLSVSPGQRTVTWWEKALIPQVYVHLAKLFKFEDVGDPRSSIAAANGQYILVRRNAYDRAGGHTAVRGEILEDVELARRIKASGRIVFLPGAAWVTTRMYRRFGEMWNGWTKNLFLLYGGDIGRLLKEAIETLGVNVLVFVILLLAATTLTRNPLAWTGGLLAALCLLELGFVHWRYSRRLRELGFPLRLTNYLIPGALIYGLLLLNSMRAYCWSGSVEWKGRVYSVKG